MKQLYWIPKRIQNKYFGRIKDLIVTTAQATSNRVSSLSTNNRQTRTFIKFSYKNMTFYFGMFWKCQSCDRPCAFVRSDYRTTCCLHHKDQITTPTPPLLKKESQQSHLGDYKKTRISSKRLGLSYDKTLTRRNSDGKWMVTLDMLQLPNISFDVKNMVSLTSTERRQMDRVMRLFNKRRGFFLVSEGKSVTKKCLHSCVD